MLTIGESIRVQLTSEPNRTAVTESGGASITAGDLHRRAGSGASRLRAEGVTDSDIVGIACQRGIGQITAMVSALFVGADFVLLDPAQESQRMERLRRTAAPAVIIDDRWIAHAAATFSPPPTI